MEDPKKHTQKNHVPHPDDAAESTLDSARGKASAISAAKVKEIEELKTKLEKAEKEAHTNLDGWQRERAEFSNYKKRIDRELSQVKNNITGDVIKKYLVVMDDMELALKNRPVDEIGAAWANGIELILRKLYSIIESEGIERIYADHVPFDPNIHEAVSHEECPGFDSGEVIEVLRQGYKLGDRILRPAMVRVAR